MHSVVLLKKISPRRRWSEFPTRKAMHTFYRAAGWFTSLRSTRYHRQMLQGAGRWHFADELEKSSLQEARKIRFNLPDCQSGRSGVQILAKINLWSCGAP